MLYLTVLLLRSVEILFSHVLQKKTNGAPNGFYAEIDWDRYVSV